MLAKKILSKIETENNPSAHIIPKSQSSDKSNEIENTMTMTIDRENTVE